VGKLRGPWGALLIVLSLNWGAARGLAGDEPAASKDFERLAQQAGEAQRQGREKEALALYEQALALNPRWADGWRNSGMLFADRKEYSRAESAFTKLVGLEPRSGSGWALLGLADYELGRFDESFRHLERGRALGIGNVDLEHLATFDAALIMIQRGEFEIAETLLKEEARSGVDDPDLVTAFGLAALRESAQPDSPEDKVLAERVGGIELDAARNKTDQAIAAYEALLAEYPKTLRLHYAYGNFLINLAHYDRALEEMQKELALNPHHVMALLQMAMTYIKLGQPEKAVPFAAKAVELAPKLFAAHYALGWALYKQGKNAPAIPELERAAKLAPDSPQAHYSLSSAYLKANRREDARRERQAFAQLKRRMALPDRAAGRP
jgi:tetratricopeptide (TPR) repeat protein